MNRIKSWIGMILTCVICTLPGCGGGSNVTSDDSTGILSIENVTAPSKSGGSGTITVKLVAPKGGPGSGSVTISSTDSALISFSPTNQSVSASGTATFYFTSTEVQTDTTISFTVKIGTLAITKPLTLPGAGVTTTPPVVTRPAANSIAFVSASPTSISLKNTGGAGRTESSIVSFIVRDVTGQPLAGQTVDFTLDTTVGDVSIIPTSAVSDSSGTIKTIVNSGVVSTPVRVTAMVKNTTISVKSDQLIISTGLPHQDGLSVSAATLNPEALDYDGVEVPVTAMLSDHFGNPVPDGTSVYFTVYGGSIEPAGTTINGKTTVKWRSQSPHPADGKVKILVFAIGEESFTDLNGNGLADPGEFTDMPEAFLSKSDNLTRNPAVDPFFDFNRDGIYNTGDGKFNGVLQGSAFSGAPRSLYVFKNFKFINSGSNAIILPDTLNITLNGSTNLTLSITDQNGNSLPDKTNISFSSTTGGCGSAKGFIIAPTSKTVNNTGSQTSFDTTLTNECTTVGSGNLIVTVKTPNGIETVKEISVTY